MPAASLRSTVRVMAWTVTAAALLLAVGFAVFVSRARTLTEAGNATADAVVVLTGGEDRISTGLQLLKEGRGRRMLVTGVNRKTVTPAELRKRYADTEELQRCCVDLGREAVDTISNADETREWAEAHGFSSLIIVTSSYHMPRSLTEFARAMPWVRLVPHGVASRHYQLHRWWLHYPTMRLLTAEYVKFLVARARLGLSRLVAAAGGMKHPARPALATREL